MKTYREIAEMHYGCEPNNVIDKEYRERRISALEKLLSEQLNTSSVVVSPCNHKNSYPFNQKYSKCFDCDSLVED